MLKVLIIDDEPIVRRGLKTVINWESFGCIISGEAPDALEGIRLVNETTPDIIMVDIKLPQISGLEFIKIIQDDGYIGKIIILSGYSDFSFAQKAIKLGVNAYLLKPIEEVELTNYIVKFIEEICESKKAQDIINNEISYQKNEFFYEQLGVMYPSQVSDSFGNNLAETYDSNSIALKLYNYVELNNMDLVLKYLEEVKSWLIKNSISPDRIKSIYIIILLELIKRFENNYMEIRGQYNCDEFIHEIYGQNSMNNLNNYSIKLLQDIAKKLPNAITSLIVKRLINYVNTNYNKDLKLESLADIFCYNSAYLGQLFKNETGEHFNAYIDKLRIENAKKLLLSGMKTSEIAEKTGFKNLDYFYCKFKKYVGMGPSEYKRRF